MTKAITIELPADDEGLRRKLDELSRIAAPDNPYRGRSESGIACQLLIDAIDAILHRPPLQSAAVVAAAEEARTALVAALEKAAEKTAPAPPIAPGSYTHETLPPLGSRAQALLDSIWEAGEKNAGPRTAEKAKRGARSRTARGRLKLTDRGGDSVLEYLAKR